MSYLVYCTFDLKKASAKDYENAYTDLQQLGLTKAVKADAGHNVIVPTMSTMWFFDGAGAISERDSLKSAVMKAFASRRFTSEISIVVGGDWAWSAATT